jgi:hypothetical protein
VWKFNIIINKNRTTICTACVKMNIWENTHTKIFIYAETPNKLFFMIIVETNLWYASNFTYFWRTSRKIFFLFSWKFCRRQNSVAKCFYCLMPTFVETLFFMPNATTYARAPKHTQDYRMLNKYIIWLYTARVRMFFMRFIFAYTFLTIRLSLPVTLRLLFIFLLLSLTFVDGGKILRSCRWADMKDIFSASSEKSAT